jgi:hypothetical protein
MCFSGLRMSQGAIHSQVASQGTQVEYGDVLIDYLYQHPPLKSTEHYSTA